MSWDEIAGSDSRTPCTLVRMFIDTCANTYGVAPCTAAGLAYRKCYNTWHTCQDQEHFARDVKELQFSSLESPLPFAGPRPYLRKDQPVPTEIRADITVRGRRKLTMLEEPDDDIGIDPYVQDRLSVQGTFWKKFLARNPNYKGRSIEIWEGFIGLPFEQWREAWIGVLDNITLDRGGVSIECKDLLQTLKDVEIPAKLDKVALITGIDDAAVEIILNTVDGLEASGHVLIEDEIIAYAGIDGAQNKLTGCTRAQGMTAAAAHDAGARVDLVRHIAPANPFDILKSFLLDDVGIDPARVDLDAWDYWRDWPVRDIDFSTWITEPTDIATLFWDIVNLLDAYVWQNEDQLITISRNVPNEPGRIYAATLTDNDLVEKTTSVDLGESYRKTDIVLYYDPKPGGDPETRSDYFGVAAAINVDTRRSESYGTSEVETLFCRWLGLTWLQEEVLSDYIDTLLARRLFTRERARASLEFSLEIKDGAIRTGDHIRLTTDELLGVDGQPLSQEIFMVWRRDPQRAKVRLKAYRMNPARIGFIAPDGHPDYDDADEPEREYGYMSQDDGKLDELTEGYVIW